MAFDDFHPHWIGLFVLLAIVALEWALGEVVVDRHPRVRLLFEMLAHTRHRGRR